MWIVVTLGLLAGMWPAIAGAGPEAAAKEAGGGHEEVEAVLRAAEAALYVGAPREALTALSRVDATRLDPELSRRHTRVELDTRVALGQEREARALAETLAAEPGWGAHVASKVWELDRMATFRDMAGLGVAFYAFAVAVLMLGAGRELLRVRPPVLALAAAFAVAAMLLVMVGPLLGRLGGLVALAWLALAHAAWATRCRASLGARGRLLVAAVWLVGVAGVGLVLVGSVPLGFAIALLSG